MSFLIWITGLSGSGKTTIASEVYSILKKKYTNTIHLDGDDFRKVMGDVNKHSIKDRKKIAMQIARLCNYLNKQNVNVICSTISLFDEIHEYNRKNSNNYYQIYINCSINELFKRDQKGIYSAILQGKKKNVVGIDIPFDIPNNCDLIIENSNKNYKKEKALQIISLLNGTR